MFTDLPNGSCACEKVLALFLDHSAEQICGEKVTYEMQMKLVFFVDCFLTFSCLLQISGLVVFDHCLIFASQVD